MIWSWKCRANYGNDTVTRRQRQRRMTGVYLAVALSVFGLTRFRVCFVKIRIRLTRLSDRLTCSPLGLSSFPLCPLARGQRGETAPILQPSLFSKKMPFLHIVPPAHNAIGRQERYSGRPNRPTSVFYFSGSGADAHYYINPQSELSVPAPLANP